jgi:hypothetical protein
MIEWNERDYLIAKMNPSLANSSAKVDSNSLKIQQLQNERSNLQKAQDLLM